MKSCNNTAAIRFFFIVLCFMFHREAFVLSHNVPGRIYRPDYRRDLSTHDPIRPDILENWHQKIPPHSRWLRGMRIFLDPGHGGHGRRKGYKSGPTGLREAEINLATALMLRELLIYKGAEVLMSRETDEYVSLSDRVDMANVWKADVFVSLHHNAAARESANYVSTWYHGSIDHRPASMNLASYMGRRMAEVMRLDEYVAQELYSDRLMFERGFGVLRDLTMPACLMEASFFTHTAEEQRLRNPEYLAQEAWAYLLGLSDYAASGWPYIASSREIVHVHGSDLPVEIRVRDGVSARGGWRLQEERIFSHSIQISIEDEFLIHEFDQKTGTITITPDQLPGPGTHTANVRMINLHGQHDHDESFKLIVREKAGKLQLKTRTAELPVNVVFPLYIHASRDRMQAGGANMHKADEHSESAAIFMGPAVPDIFVCPPKDTPHLNMDTPESAVLPKQICAAGYIDHIEPFDNGRAIVWLKIPREGKIRVTARLDQAEAWTDMVLYTGKPRAISGRMSDFRPLVATSIQEGHIQQFAGNRFFFEVEDNISRLNPLILSVHPEMALPVTQRLHSILEGKPDLIIPVSKRQSSRAPSFMPETARLLTGSPPPLLIQLRSDDFPEFLDHKKQNMTNNVLKLLIRSGYRARDFAALQTESPDVSSRAEPFSWLLIFEKSSDNSAGILHKRWDDTSESAGLIMARLIQRHLQIPFALIPAPSSQLENYRGSALLVRVPASHWDMLCVRSVAAIIKALFR